MESDPPLVDAVPSGCPFPDWISARGCAKSTAYRMRSELGIELERRRRGGIVQVWLSQEQADLMTAYADALGRGMSTAEALASIGHGAALVKSGGDHGKAAPLVPMAPETPESGGDDERSVLETLRCRLAALRDAVELGAPLKTPEAALLLGARPGGAQVTRGRIRAVRDARNCWVLERLTTP
jgi:hypothetical protein